MFLDFHPFSSKTIVRTFKENSSHLFISILLFDTSYIFTVVATTPPLYISHNGTIPRYSRICKHDVSPLELFFLPPQGPFLLIQLSKILTASYETTTHSLTPILLRRFTSHTHLDILLIALRQYYLQQSQLQPKPVTFYPRRTHLNSSQQLASPTY